MDNRGERSALKGHRKKETGALARYQFADVNGLRPESSAGRVLEKPTPVKANHRKLSVWRECVQCVYFGLLK